MSEGSPTARVLSLTHGQVCYLQLPAADGARAAAFYAAVFGWDIEEHTPDFVAPAQNPKNPKNPKNPQNRQKRQASNRLRSMVDPGSTVDSVHSHALDPPPSPDQPQKAAVEHQDV